MRVRAELTPPLRGPWRANRCPLHGEVANGGVPSVSREFLIRLGNSSANTCGRGHTGIAE